MIRRLLALLQRRRPLPPIAMTVPWETRVGIIRLAMHIRDASR